MIKGTIVGGDQVAAKFQRIQAQAMPKLTERIARVVTKLQTRVVASKLSGQVLKVRTGTLRRSIHNDVTATGGTVTGIVGTNMEYAAFHEYGFHGTENVKEHMRTIKQAFGKPLKSPKKITISAYARKVNYPEHSFLRSALADMRQEILVDIYSGVKELIKS
jgi:phage gpG-like protein